MKENKKLIIIIFIALIIAVSLFAILLIKKKNVSNTNTPTEVADNSLGMKFGFDIEEFEKTYLKTLKNNFSEYKNLLDKGQIDAKFSKSADTGNYELNQSAYDEQNNLIKYFCISLEPESNNSKYTNLIKVSAITETSENIAKYAEDNIFYAFMAIDSSLTYEKAKNIYYEMSMSEKNYITNGNITYAFDINSSIDCTIINIFPFSEQQYTEFINGSNNNEIITEDLDTDSTNISEKIVMPNLVGMNYKDLRNYFDNNNLSFIQNIYYKTDYESNYSTSDIILPTKIISTIPAAGTELDPYTDTSITVYADYVYAVREFYMEYENEDEDWETKYFGKIIKIQIGKNEDNYIEGIIGEGFYTYRLSYDSIGLRCNQFSSTSEKNFWEKYEKHLVSYVLPEDIIKKEDAKTVDVKIFIDNQLLENTNFHFSGSRLTLKR